MIEVFKTNINEVDHARMIIQLIENTFKGYKVNFDLEDCDRILRVKSTGESIASRALIALLKRIDFDAEILQEETSYVSGPFQIL